MTTVLVYLVVIVVVAAVVFVLASAIFGRDEALAPLPINTSPTDLPAAGITPDDVSALTFQQVVRGYKMSEVDWALSRLAKEIDTLQRQNSELAELLQAATTSDSRQHES